MGIIVEFNPNLALREHGTSGRLEEECVPKNLERGGRYRFLKEGQRNYWLEGEIPLRITEGNQKLSRPIASVVILEATHFTKDAQVYLAIRKAFAKEDLAMLRFAMFRQLNGEVSAKNVEEVGEKFLDTYKEINAQLSHPLKDKVHAYVKRYMPPFFILQQIPSNIYW